MSVSQRGEVGRRNLLGELERNSVPYVHTIATWTSPSVQIEWNPLLILIQYEVQVSVAKDKSSAEHAMRLMSCDFFEPFQQQLVNPLGAKSVYKLIIVDSFGIALLVDTS